MTRQKDAVRFLLCVNADAYPASLEARKVYRALADPDAEVKGFVRVVDESGEDYLYPQSMFVAVDLPQAAVEALLSARSGGAA
ncbi:MAG TPA: hypothetical protein DDY78_23195 [Planctomycetales bacterium]|jgi:hypothetical protein|nr:hypothetical protein [Planctomycetales bacterium]